MKNIALATKDYNTIVDDEDFASLSKFKWYLGKSKTSKTVRTMIRVNGKRIMTAMSRMITKAPKGMVVDHINGNIFDNRKSNLRICTSQQNLWNRNKPRTGKNPYKGVYKTPYGKFYVAITKDYKIIQGGSYDDPKEAAIVYDQMAKNLFGEYAKTNF